MSNCEYCPRCGRKTFEYYICKAKIKCSSCGYFLLTEDFERIKKEAKNKDDKQARY
jgi:ribosomal protein L37E